MTRIGPARPETNADDDTRLSWSALDIEREIEALRSLHDAVKSALGGSEVLTLGYCALIVLRRELSEIRQSIDSASRRAFPR